VSARKDDSALPSKLVVADVEDPDDTKAQLQRRMDDARESISRTVGEIKETVEDQYATAKDAISGILDWRADFQQNPVVWSVGALSAGFALGYTVGRAQSAGSFGSKHAGVGAFVDTLVSEVAMLGSHLPLSTLDPTIKRVLGFDLSQLFEEMSEARHKAPRRRKPTPAKRHKGSRVATGRSRRTRTK
jgi:hypothetical protein